jgi:hypothetical protein
MAIPAPDGGGSSDLYIDAAAMATEADSLGNAASTVTGARDAINTAWKTGGTAFGSTVVVGAFDECCRVWITGTNSIGQLTQYVAQYTQNIANAFGSADQTLASSATQMYDPSTLPKPGTHYKSQPQSRYTA